MLRYKFIIFIFTLLFSIGLKAQEEGVYTDLAKAYEEADSVIQLDLTGKGLDSLPPIILEMKNMRVLKISGNHGMDFGQAFRLVKDMPNLTEIYCNTNYIIDIPAEAGLVRGLKKLSFWKCHIQNVPPEIGNLSNLEELILNDNDIKTLPEEFGNLTNLKRFEISSNLLVELPKSIGNLTKMEILNIYGNRLGEFNPGIFNMTQLTELDASFNFIPEIPDGIGNLTRLTKFHIYCNYLKKISANIRNCAVLKEFFIYSNKLPDQEIEQVLDILPWCNVKVVK